MATRSFARAAVVAAVGMLLTTTSGGVVGSAATPAAKSDGVAAIVAGYQARIPDLMAQEHIPGLALALVDGDRVVWQQGVRLHGQRRGLHGDPRHDVQCPVDVEGLHRHGRDAGRRRPGGSTSTSRSRPTCRVSRCTAPSRPTRSGRSRCGCCSVTPRASPTRRRSATATSRSPATSTRTSRSISETWLRFPVGTGYAYSNLGIDLAGYILERVSRQAVPGRDARLAARAVGHGPQHLRPSAGARHRRPGGGSHRRPGAAARGLPDDGGRRAVD